MEKRNEKWFSRRHETSDAHDAERAKREAEAIAKSYRFGIRSEVRSARNASDQLAELDRRLGVGVGAAKERARLIKQISK